MAIEIVDFPIKNGGSFHCNVSSPEGIMFFSWVIVQFAKSEKSSQMIPAVAGICLHLALGSLS